MKKIYGKVEISVEDIKEAISFKEALEIIENFKYKDDFEEKILDLLSLDDTDYIGYISDKYMEKHILDNINYYVITSEMQKKIKQLEEQINEFENQKREKPTVPELKYKAREFFTDLFDLSHHASTDEIINRLKSAIL